jgi:DNA-directed RNA polymerase
MYSGLLRDKTGAKSTCVIGDTRSDLYQEVADSVNEKLLSDKYPRYVAFVDKSGVERIVPTKVEAESLAGKVTRKMTKRNVMTIPYSVSLRGMKMQNWEVMDDMKLEGKAFWKGDEWVVNYLWTTLVHESVYEIVKGARRGQEYLKDVVRNLKAPALWHTPIYNLPVLQSAYKSKELRIKTVLGTLSISQFLDEPNRQKQLASVAANFIHSIDAAILMYVVEHMKGDIGTIHDCFLVHPNKGEEVRNRYKEGYVEIMRADPLKMFSEELDKDKLVEIPYVNDLDLEEVYDSKYIIS